MAEGPPQISFAGQTNLGNFSSLDRATSEEFLKWKSLFVGGIQADVNPLRLAINEVALSDFYSRLIVYPNGTLNLREMLAGGEAPPAPGGGAGAGAGESPAAAPAKKQPTSGSPTAEPASIAIGRVVLQGLSFNVDYKIANRKLKADNQLILDQLTFGEKVESPTATKLPVLLAVALLKDRNGVIDLNLPIGGSLDDPEFSVGRVILQVLLNLIAKAATSPFALLGAAFGGGEELSYVDFQPGLAALDDAAIDKLSKIGKALNGRPGLTLDISGRADPVADREGLKRYLLERAVKAQKVKDLVKKGESAPSFDKVTVEPSEYEQYLTRAYKEAKFPKPRNVIGLVKELPVPEMEKLIITNTEITDEDLLQLANERAAAAQEYLINTAQVSADRVFLVSPKIEAGEGGEKGSGSRVKFALK
ncbi:MAG: hypothetical protein H6Q51_515 [Deltaproteobacteria bacterium]|nr:hypothetical protein [Deltaproteobacteria bacterium]